MDQERNKNRILRGKSNLGRMGNAKTGNGSHRPTKVCNKHSKLRVWLVLLAASCWSMYSLHKTIGGEDGFTTSALRREIELESKYVASLFGEAAKDAAAALVGDVSKGMPSLGGVDNNLFSSQQGRQILQSNWHSHEVDFSKFDPGRNHAIVIPYRDRTFHLEKFIEHMGPYLRHNFPDDSFELWIVEQDDGFLFNRAWLVNVGLASIKEQNKEHQYQQLQARQRAQRGDGTFAITIPPPPTCIILHDVDLIPTVDGVPYTKCTRPIQLGSELAHFNNSIPYPMYTGGVGPSMTLEHWNKINGMSNDFFGWGGEDDELWHRLRLTGLLKKRTPRKTSPPDPKTGKKDGGPKFWPPEIMRPPKGFGKFRPISEAQTVHHNQKNHNQWQRIGYILELMQNNSARWKRDGLSDLRMTITGDATTVTHMDSIISTNSSNHVETDPSVVSSTTATTTTMTRTHYATAKARGSIVTSLSIEPSALASFAAIHHIKAIPKITALEFIHITQSDGNRIERAGAKARVAWGACHYHHAMEREMRCPDIALPELEGNVQLRPGLDTHTPWHSPLQDFMRNPFRGRPTFAVVRNPYHRLIGFFYCPWNGYKGDRPNDPESLNTFIQHALYPPTPPTDPPKEGEKTSAPKRPPTPAAMKYLRPNYHYVFATNEISAHNRPFITHVLHYENIREDFTDLMKIYGLEQKIVLPDDRLVAKTESPQALTEDAFTDDTLRMIHHFYGKDFVRFGYKMKYVKPRPPNVPPTAIPTATPIVPPK